MNVDYSLQIIKNYWSSFQDLRPERIVQNSSILKYTPATIKYAHFVFGEHLVNTDGLDKKMFKILMESYGLINTLFVEDDEEINAAYKNHINALKENIIDNYRIPNPFGKCEEVLEYLNFIGECLHYSSIKKTPYEILEEDVLATFVYEGLRKKAVEENDVSLFKEIANSRITRFLHFEGRKTNEESFFA